MKTSTPDRHAVVGNGMVGQRFVASLADSDRARRWRVTVLGEEPRQAYDLDLVPSDCYDGLHYRLLLKEQIVRIDRNWRRVITAAGNDDSFDALVLATGSYPFMPPVPGHDLPNCSLYRTIEDLDAIKAAVAQARARNHGRLAGLVVGGGLLGLEAAHALRLLGISQHVVVLAPRLMPLQVGEAAASC